MLKIFTTLDVDCPFRTGVKADSPQCRQCIHFYRTGTATFFWCNHPNAIPEEKLARPTEEKPKRGRPKGTKSQKAKKRAYKPLKTKR